jgi:hypothetical protein
LKVDILECTKKKPVKGFFFAILSGIANSGLTVCYGLVVPAPAAEVIVKSAYASSSGSSTAG